MRKICYLKLSQFTYRDMRFIIILLSFSLGEAFAQISPAFDPNVYLPRIGVPGEIDTIMNVPGGAGLGYRLMNIGIPPGQTNANMMIYGLPQNPPFFTEVSTGPTFDLHKLNIRKQLDLDDKTIIKYAHFHDTKHIDLFAYNTDGLIRIYWQDDFGNYSKSRATEPISSKYGDSVGYTTNSNPYSAYLTSDTVEDILISIGTSRINHFLDSAFISFFEGGQQLYQKGASAISDTDFFLGLTGSAATFERHFSQGDWRGIGREDLIAADRTGNIMYYKNDASKPFSIAEFYMALQFDTIFTVRENPHFQGNGYQWESQLSMKALSKTPGDKSLDLVLSPSTDDWRNGGIWFFRGGSEFGSHRITLDSVEYVIRHPQYYDPVAFNGLTFPAGIFNCGDMTGTGNNVLLVDAAFDLQPESLQFFYVTGAALDDKADMYYLAEPNGGGPSDTLTANDDNLEDVMIGMFDLNNVGSLHVVYGSKKIPVRINSVQDNHQPKQSLEIYPNILSNATTLTLSTEKSEPVTIVIRDVLGRAVFEEKRFSIGGAESIALRVPSLPSGRYFLQVMGADIFASAPITIIH